MPIQFPGFQPGQVPRMQPVQPFQPPQVPDPSHIIMQAYQLRQQRQLAQQQMNQRSLEDMTNAIQTTQKLQEEKRHNMAEEQLRDMQVKMLSGEMDVHEAEARLTNARAAMQESMNANGVNPDYYTKDQAAALTHLYQPDKSLDEIKQAYNGWPGNLVPKDSVHMFAMSGKFDMDRMLREQKMAMDQWNNVARNEDVLMRGNTYIGQAAQNNANARRALALLRNPNLSDQDVNAINQDVGRILRGGTATEGLSNELNYKTLQGQLNAAATFWSSTPQSARNPAQQQKLMDNLREISMVSNDTLDNHYKSLRASNMALITRDPQSWDNWEALQRKSNMIDPSEFQLPQLQPAGGMTGFFGGLMNQMGLSHPAVQAPTQGTPVSTGWTYGGVAQ